MRYSKPIAMTPGEISAVLDCAVAILNEQATLVYAALTSVVAAFAPLLGEREE